MRNKPRNKGDGSITGYVTRGHLVNAFWLILAVFIFGVRASDAATTKELRILALGTSLTQGFNLPPGTDFTSVLQAELRKRGHNVVIVNAGVSGDTSAGGLARLDWALAEPYDGAIVEFGSNDALRGMEVAMTRANLEAIVLKLQAKGLVVMLAGMKAPRNLGPEYATEFDAVYPDLAKKHKLILYPFFLEGVAANLKLNQADGIHPNEAGTKIIIAGILPYVEKLIAQIEAKAKAEPKTN